MKAILPKRKLDASSAFDAAEDKFSEEIVSYAAREFRTTYSTWSAQSTPDEIFEHTVSPGETTWVVGATGKVYGWVSGGTGPREIVSETPMWFQPGYKPKTYPGHIESGASSRTGPYLGPTWIIENHEIEAREFDVTVRDVTDERLSVRAKEIADALVDNIWK